MRFALDPGFNSAQLRRQFEERGRVSIRPMLPEDQARALRSELLARTDWQCWICDEQQRHYKISADEFFDWGPEKIAAVRSLVDADRPSDKFRFVHRRLDIFDEHSDSVSDNLLGSFAAFLNGDEVLTAVRMISGLEEINFADAFAARYDPGDFLSRHDDLRPTRKLAYVLGLSENWRNGWGGELEFHRPGDTRHAKLAPQFNSLTLFAVPTDHHVVAVAHDAAEPRLTVTGWFRTLEDKPE